MTQLEHDQAFGRILTAINAELRKCDDKNDRWRLVESLQQEISRLKAAKENR